mmetsp:Transcript_13315/g.30289  ORF Transcript_13315/g.30289 Transcript_13315/m.30289 type:complete len:243 (+) Transcript_13315:894-1622(+)
MAVRRDTPDPRRQERRRLRRSGHRREAPTARGGGGEIAGGVGRRGHVSGGRRRPQRDGTRGRRRDTAPHQGQEGVQGEAGGSEPPGPAPRDTGTAEGRTRQGRQAQRRRHREAHGKGWSRRLGHARTGTEAGARLRPRKEAGGRRDGRRRGQERWRRGRRDGRRERPLPLQGCRQARPQGEEGERQARGEPGAVAQPSPRPVRGRPARQRNGKGRGQGREEGAEEVVRRERRGRPEEGGASS